MKISRCLSALTVAALLCSVPFQAAAAYAPTGPGAEPEMPRYSEEQLARLQDNILEYDEIDDRVKNYNPAISDAWDQYDSMKEDYKGVVTELVNEYEKVKTLADSYISIGETMGSEAGQQLVKSGKTLESGYSDIVGQMRTTVNEWDNASSANSTIRRYQKQVVSGAQSAMIGYDTIRQNITTLETMVELYQKQYDMYQRMAGLGLATDKDLLNAKNSLLSAQSQLMALSNQQDSTRRTLCLLLGYDPDTNPDIRPIPEFDLSRLGAMNLEEDTTKAIGNNYTLISQRRSAKGGTNSQIDARKNTIDEGDQKLTIEMQRLYQDVMDKKAAYDAAVIGLDAAERSRGAAERQYQNGLTSEMQYVGQMLSYYQKKAAKESASLSLWQAMETYDWAISGLATVE